MVNECWGSPVTPEAWMPTHGGTEVAESTEGLRQWSLMFNPADTSSSARQTLSRTLLAYSFLVYECILCQCQFGLTLDSEGEVAREVIIPPERKSA